MLIVNVIINSNCL